MKIVYVLIIAIATGVVAAGIIFLNSGNRYLDNSSQRNIKYITYKIDISNTSNEEYEVILPWLADERGNVTCQIENEEIKDFCEIKKGTVFEMEIINDTKYNKLLRIKGKNDTYIECNWKSRDVFFTLTTVDPDELENATNYTYPHGYWAAAFPDDTHYYWIYLNSSASVCVNLYVEERTGWPWIYDISIECEIIPGWNRIKGRHSEAVY